jgi:hypothetical protein
MSAKKGEAIRFIGGTYSKANKSTMTGWFNASKEHTPCMYQVIVDLGNGKEKVTKVMKESVRIVSEEAGPTCFEEAVLQQHPDIDKAMDKLAQELAKCGVHAQSNEISRILSQKILNAFVAQSMAERCKGSLVPRRMGSKGAGAGVKL